MLVLLNQRLHAIDTIPLAPIKYIYNKANRMLYYVIALISNNIVLLIISILDKHTYYSPECNAGVRCASWCSDSCSYVWEHGGEHCLTIGPRQ